MKIMFHGICQRIIFSQKIHIPLVNCFHLNSVKKITMKKLIISMALFGLSFQSMVAQLKLNINLLSDNETYLVSMLAEQTIASPLNRTSNIQVVIDVPSEESFTAGNIQSLLPEITWVDNAYSDEVNQGNTSNLIAFAMQERSTTALPFVEGVETPLFTFQNMEPGCVGAIRLVDNESAIVQEAIAVGLNFTQNFTVLALRGNAFSGLLNAEADCSIVNTMTSDLDQIGQVKIYPVPTVEMLNVEWDNTTNQEKIQLNLLDFSGQLHQSFEGNGQKGNQSLQLNLVDYPAGLYQLQFQSEGNLSPTFKFVLVNQ